jgi:biopolymer transport protein ExbB
MSGPDGMSLVEVVRAGGPIMWPLAACSLVAVAIILERAVSLRSARILRPSVVERVIGLAEGGRLDLAIEACRANPGLYTNIVLAGLTAAARGESEAVAKEAIEDAGRHETVRLNHYLGLLGTIVGVAPLLGLLGTVTGMIEVFRTIAASGSGEAAALSGGIAQALITTAAGLLIAIPALVAYNYYLEKADRLVTDLERESLRVLRGAYQSGRAVERTEAHAALRGD